MYCTRQDLVDRIGEGLLTEVSDLERTGVASEARVQQACEDSTAEIDSAVAERYTTPLAPVPVLIRSLCVDLAVSRLFAARGYNKDSADSTHADAAKNARDLLILIARGQRLLGATRPQKDLGASVQASGRLFGRDKMKGF